MSRGVSKIRGLRGRVVAMLILGVGAVHCAQQDDSMVLEVKNQDIKTQARAPTLNANESARELEALIHYEIDGSYILGQAIESIEDQGIREKLMMFKTQCEDSERELSGLIRKLGHEVPAHSRDLKGFIMQGYTVMRGLISDLGVLEALRTNLQLILNAYERVLKTDLPTDVEGVVLRLYGEKQDQMAHINYEIQKQ